ncbi:MAG: response regulator [Polyangiaceae bacterium]|nr:response regulator [Polyangiaceae bacterium]
MTIIRSTTSRQRTSPTNLLSSFSCTASMPSREGSRGHLRGRLAAPVLPVRTVAEIRLTLTDGESKPVVQEPDKSRSPFSRGLCWDDQRVLVVDDNSVNRIVADRLMKKLGFEVELAVDGQAAVAAATAGDFDLILMDCHMPVMNGHDATRELRHQGLTRPILALTADVVPGVADECTRSGMNGYLTKPMVLGELYAALEKFLETPTVPDDSPPLARAASIPSIVMSARLSKPSATGATTWRGRRVLVVDDNSVNRLVARKLMQKLGFEVQLAKDGREGVEAFKEGQFDLILMDLHMPELNSYDASREIRASGDTVPIFALTADTTDGTWNACLDAGMNAYLSKPIELERLVNAVRMFVGPGAEQEAEAPAGKSMSG